MESLRFYFQPNMTQLQLAILASVLVAFAVYTVKSYLYGKQISSRIQKQGSSPLLSLHAMEFAYWCLRPIGQMAALMKLSPDLFSWLCFSLGLASGYSAACGHLGTAGVLGALSAIADALDGLVARSRGVASDAGEVLDAAIDRYAEFFFLGGLTIYYRFHSGLMALTLSALLGSIMVSYSQAKAEAMQVGDIPKGWMRRPERAVYLNGGAFLAALLVGFFEAPSSTPYYHYPMIFSVCIVSVLSNACALQRYFHMYRTIRIRERK